jgi:hypothetical protein
MHQKIFFLMVMACLACSGLSYAQTGGGQTEIGPGVQHNMGKVAGMMKEIHQMMHQGQFTSKQATQVTEMMTRMGAMMKEMSGSQGEQLARQHEQELKEMRRRVDIIKKQLKSQ